MTAPHLVDQRLRTLEARASNLEKNAEVCVDALYRLERRAALIELRMARVLAALGAEDVTEAEVDAALDDA